MRFWKPTGEGNGSSEHRRRGQADEKQDELYLFSLTNKSKQKFKIYILKL